MAEHLNTQPRRRVWTHRWYWRKFVGERKDRVCRVLCRGSNGNLLIEFEDGHLVVAPRFAVRRLP